MCLIAALNWIMNHCNSFSKNLLQYFSTLFVLECTTWIFGRPVFTSNSGHSIYCWFSHLAVLWSRVTWLWCVQVVTTTWIRGELLSGRLDLQSNDFGETVSLNFFGELEKRPIAQRPRRRFFYWYSFIYNYQQSVFNYPLHSITDGSLVRAHTVGLIWYPYRVYKRFVKNDLVQSLEWHTVQ